ncbi:hypothetical protein [Phyllobacterium sophorae]|uniref:hypothetical protein n=1 Tax=Phyllobacterium sophorae TaxID=1520277 RepID=UPI001FE12DB0|nr:hypothetical protein [Phyllobacterium sophorae]
MISLRPMRPDEFTAYLDYFIRDYGAEISTNYGLSDVDARAQAIREIDEDLPQGTKTAGQVLLCIIAGASTVIGYLWYRQDLAARSAFISDFHIFTGKQGNGYGKQALPSWSANWQTAATPRSDYAWRQTTTAPDTSMIARGSASLASI